jgi:hypothetical protein
MIDQHRMLAFDPLDDPPGLEIVDKVEQLRYRFQTTEPLSPTPADPDGFLFPVGSAVTVTLEEIVLPSVVGVVVWDRSGEMIAEVGHLDEASLDEGSYVIELSAQITTYVEVEGPLDISTSVLETRLAFGDATEARVGAVSCHERPAATVTTTDDPVEMMRAVSTFGSALKTTTAERSYPSNRGHPPAIERGDELHVPDGMDSPDTGVRLELPPTYEAVYTAAPLAYYLGADLVPGSVPRLVTDRGFEHQFDATTDFETGVERTLKQVFLLDCLTRTEGIYDVPLRERRELEGYLGLDFADLYDRPLAAQVATYLEVPYTLVADHVPEWRLTVHVESVAGTVEHLPFVVDDLAIVRTAETPGTTGSAPGPETTQELTREGVLTRSAAESSGADDTSYVQPESSTSLEQAWIGERIPIGASKLTTAAFQNRLDRDVTDGDISITIVLNDERMDEERDIVNRAYGNRENLPFEIAVERDLTVEGLREQLREDTNFLHYIGHTETDGFRCADGKLDVTSIDETGVDAFLLNACNSYHQGLGLIEAGAIGGIVTLSEVINDGAVRIGESIARLLNAGFPLRAALTIAREESILGGQYIVVGDGGMTVTQAPSRTPTLLEIESSGEDFEMAVKTYATDDAGLGSLYMPHLDGVEEYFLSSGGIDTFQLSDDSLKEFLQLENAPVKNGDQLLWSNSVDTEHLR